MIKYIITRLIASIPTLIGISLVCFFLVQLTPGGPVEQALAKLQASQTNGGEVSTGKSFNITDEQREAITQYYGFDKPIYIRYFKWMGKLLSFNLGESYSYEEPVWGLIIERFPVSIIFGIISFLAAYLVCIPLGILKAIKHNSLFDTASSVVIFFLYSVPAFALAIVLIVLFCGGSYWDIFPIEGMVSDNYDSLSLSEKIKDIIHHMFLPIVCYAMGAFAMLTMLMKNSLMEQLRQDYITTARAKGLTEKKILLKHALRNALLPIANGFGQWIGIFFTGSLLIETIFNLQGIGRLSYDAILQRDYPIVLANIMIISVISIIGNLISDLLYVAIDPRIDYQS